MKKIIGAVVPLLCLVMLVVWQLISKSSNYYLVTVAVLIISIIPFFVSFERSMTSAREISLIASLIAIAVVSRAAFYLIPQVKPIGAVVIVSAACIGGNKGYFVGAMSAFISNFIFGQGIWTPFQMVALGLVGFISGMIFDKAKPDKLRLCIVGFVLIFFVYGFIVDTCSVVTLTSEFTPAAILSTYGSGAIFSLLYALATVVFMAMFGDAFIKKLNRLIVKYGILEV